MAEEEPSLEELIKQWIRAEYMARLGDPEGGENYFEVHMELEDKIRERVTGAGDLYEAAKVLGVMKERKGKK